MVHTVEPASPHLATQHLRHGSTKQDNATASIAFGRAGPYEQKRGTITLNGRVLAELQAKDCGVGGYSMQVGPLVSPIAGDRVGRSTSGLLRYEGEIPLRIVQVV